MAKRRLVVDASVAISAGSSSDVISIRCRHIIEQALEGHYLVVMTDEIEREWKDADKPQTKRSLQRLRQLYSKHRIVWLDAQKIFDMALRDAIDHSEAYKDDNRMPERRAMMEDVHLLEAAQASDRVVLSRDSVSKHFVLLAREYPPIRVIVWVNPDHTDDLENWLRNGAAAKPQRQLAYHPPPTDIP